jgi:tetratricopeptide (TPR) repeat protein
MIRAKTKRRLVILLVAGVSFMALAGGAYAVRKAWQRSQALSAGKEGVAAAKAGDYKNALKQIYVYRRKYPNDIEALYYFALARQNVPEPDGGNLLEAASLWRQYVDVKPDDIEARRRLLDLYLNLGFNSESLDEADALLKRVPDDPASLRARAIAFYRLRKFADAQQAIERLTRLKPDDFENQLLSFTIQSANGATPQQLVAKVVELRKAHPNDVQFALLLSIAYANANDRTAAAEVIRKAAAQPMNSPKMLQLLVNQLDLLELNAESVAVVRATAAAHPEDAAYQRILASRLFVAADYDALDELVRKAAKPIADDPQVLVIQGLSLAQRGKLADASLIFQSVKTRASTDPVAAAIATAASALWIDSLEPKARVEVCRGTLQKDSGNPFLHFLLAEANSMQGDSERALREWRSAYSIAPAWGLPRARCARDYLNAGRIADALATARLAQERAPNDRDTLITLAMSWAATIGPNQVDEGTKLLALINNVRARFPDAQELRPLLVSVLGRLGHRNEALAEFRAALNMNPPALETTFLQLAAVSRVQNLGLESECFDQSAKAHGMTPQLAFAKATALSRANRSSDALSFFESVMSKRDADAPWRLAYARLLSLLDDPRAKATWIAVADAFPKNTQIQWSALTAPGVQDDHEFLGRTVERLRDQLGQDNVEGRLAQALWLLQGRPTPKQTSEASVILGDITRAAPNLTEPRMLLAKCLQELGNISGAVEQMRIVARARPDDDVVALRLASLLMLQGEVDAARAELEIVAREPNSPAVRQQAASMFLSLGDRNRARKILEQHTDASSAVLLAQIFMQQGEPAKAEEICKKFLAAPTPALLDFYANFLGSQGRPTEAREILAKLDTIDARPSVRELIRAEFAVRFGKPEEALAQYLAATRAAPKEPGAWRSLLLYCLRTGRVDNVQTYLAQALAQIPDDPGFAALKARFPLFQDLTAMPGGGNLLPALLQNLADIDVIDEAIQLAVDDRKGATGAQTATKIRQLAEQHPKILAIQLFAIEFLAGKGQFENAATLATRAMSAFPSSASVARVCTGALGGAGRWSDAIATAKQWRQRDPDQAMQADMVIAATSLQMGDPTTGLRQLEPYIARAFKAPDDYESLITVYAQSLLAARQSTRAQDLLSPLLTSPRWRSNWMSLAGSIADMPTRITWVARVVTAIPADAVSEKIALAHCYQQLASATGDNAWKVKTHQLVDPLVSRADLGAGDLVALGLLFESQKDIPTAEQLYRRAVKVDPKQVIALNNLAMILLNADRNLQEALDFAKHAVQVSGKPTFYDTQANVLARQKDYDNALKSIDSALQVDPDNAEWQATRLAILAQANRREQVNSEFLRFKATGAMNKLSDGTRSRLAALGLK